MKPLKPLGVLLLLAASCVAVADDEVGAFVPAFKAPPESVLGLNTAAVVHLAIWRTLRRAPYPNPHKLSFGSAIVRWSEEPMGDVTPL
jgi:hypothetical protein